MINAKFPCWLAYISGAQTANSLYRPGVQGPKASNNGAIGEPNGSSCRKVIDSIFVKGRVRKRVAESASGLPLANSKNQEDVSLDMEPSDIHKQPVMSSDAARLKPSQLRGTVSSFDSSLTEFSAMQARPDVCNAVQYVKNSLF